MEYKADKNLIQIETNIDNMNPELYTAVLENLLTMGVNDAWLTPIIMKKGRPAILLSILCDNALLEEVEAFLFTQTTTIGFRYFPVERSICERTFQVVEYRGFPIHVKRAFYKGECVNTTLEYEDVAAAASGLKQPLKLIEQEVMAIVVSGSKEK